VQRGWADRFYCIFKNIRYYSLFDEATTVVDNRVEELMTNEKPHKPLGRLAAGLLFTLAIFWLSAWVALAAAPQQKDKKIKEAAQLQSSPDNAVQPSALKTAAVDPPPTPPPYNPVPMTADIGMTGLVVYANTNGVALINPRNHSISPVLLNEFNWDIDPETTLPFGGQLGTEGGGRFDLAMTSDGRQALISNFGDSKVFFVDLSSGTPVVSGMAEIDFFAEDISIDPTNEWALVADGGFRPCLAVLHIPTRSWVPAGVDPVTHEPISYRLPGVAIDDEEDPDYPGYSRYANSVDIAPDGRTVIVADALEGAVHVLLFDPATGALSVQQTIKLWKYGTDHTAVFPVVYYPFNSAISPDGKTVLLANPDRTAGTGDVGDPTAIFEGCNIAVLRIDQPGHVVRMPDIILPWNVTGGQSIVFSPDGRKAFYETVNWEEYYNSTTGWPRAQEIQVISISGAGEGKHTGTIHTPSWRGNSQLFGVDTMAVTPDGNFLYVTNPTLSGASPIIDVIDIRSLRHVKQIGTPTHYPDPTRNYPDPPDPPNPNIPADWIEQVIPVGIAFPPALPNKPPVAVIAVDNPELILDLNEAATFNGGGSYDPEKSPLTYDWSLISVPAGASPTLSPSGQTAVLTPDANIEGTYQVGLVVNDGSLDSKMATASVVAGFAPVLSPAGATLQRLESNFIFYKEYVNRLAWTANPENKGIIAAVKVFRKAKSADDSSYGLLVSLAPTATGYDDKGLAADQLFTYRITSVSSRGKESDPVVVGN
jgi:hypothetical protein